MRRAIGLCVAGALALNLGLAGADEPPAADEPAGTKALGTVHVMADPTSALAKAKVLEYCLGSDEKLLNAAVQSAAPEVAKSNPQAANVYPTVEGFLELPGGGSVFQVDVTSRDPRLAADKLLKAYVEELNKALVTWDTRQKINEEQVTLASEALRHLEPELHARMDELNKLTAVTKSSAAGGDAAAQRDARLELQLESVVVEIQGLKVREEALQEAIVEMADKVREEGQDDPVVAELKKAVAIREQLLSAQKALYQAASVDRTTILKSEYDLITAQAELAKFRREAMSAGKERLAELEARLRSTRIELVESEAKQKILEEFKRAVTNPVQIAIKRTGVEQLQKAYDQLARQYQELRTKQRLYLPPSAVLVAGWAWPVPGAAQPSGKPAEPALPTPPAAAK